MAGRPEEPAHAPPRPATPCSPRSPRSPGPAAAQQRQACAKNLGGFVATAAISLHRNDGNFISHQRSGGLALGQEFCVPMPPEVGQVMFHWTVYDLSRNRECSPPVVSVTSATRQVDASVHGTVFNPHCYASPR